MRGMLKRARKLQNLHGAQALVRKRIMRSPQKSAGKCGAALLKYVNLAYAGLRDSNPQSTSPDQSLVATDP